MWRKFLLLWLIVGAANLPATQKRLDSILLPVYYHGSDTDPMIATLSVPYAVYSSEPEWIGAAMSKPYIPPALEENHKPGDVNLLSLYGIRVSSDLVVDEVKRTSGPDVIVTIDASQAAQPDGYPFSIEEVIESARACAEKNVPNAKGRTKSIKVIDPAAPAP